VERNKRGSPPGLGSIEAGASLWLNAIVRYKQPRSVQVVIFADGPRERHYLLSGASRVTAGSGSRDWFRSKRTRLTNKPL